MAEYVINFGSHAKSSDVSEHSRGVLKAIMASAEVYSVKISSTARDAYDQARVMSRPRALFLLPVRVRSPSSIAT